MKFSHTSITVGAVVVTAVLASTLSAGATALITGAQIRDRSVTGVDIAKNSLTGTEINENRLARVPRAASADTLSG